MYAVPMMLMLDWRLVEVIHITARQCLSFFIQRDDYRGPDEHALITTRNREVSAASSLVRFDVLPS